MTPPGWWWCHSGCLNGWLGSVCLKAGEFSWCRPERLKTIKRNKKTIHEWDVSFTCSCKLSHCTLKRVQPLNVEHKRSCLASWGALTSVAPHSGSLPSSAPANIHICTSCLIHISNATNPPSATVYIIMPINDGANYLLVRCSESNEEHRRLVSPHRASITSTSPMELNDDGAGRVRNSCNGPNQQNGWADGTDHSGSVSPYCPSV